MREFVKRYRRWRVVVAELLLLAISSGVALAAWTTPKTWVDREVLTVSDVNTYVRDNTDLLKTSVNDDGTIDPQDTGYWKYATKTADQTVTTSTVLVAITDLSFFITANSKWIFELHLKGTSSGVADWRFNADGPGTADAMWYGIIGSDPNAASDPVAGATETETATIFIHGTSSEQSYILHGYIDNGASAGSVVFKFAQRASSGSTIIRANSYLRAMRVL